MLGAKQSPSRTQAVQRSAARPISLTSIPSGIEGTTLMLSRGCIIWVAGIMTLRQVA